MSITFTVLVQVAVQPCASVTVIVYVVVTVGDTVTEELLVVPGVQ